MLITEDDAFTWHPSLCRRASAPRFASPVPLDEENGPARRLRRRHPVASTSPTCPATGLSDIVRIRNGEVCYWPNLGYGRFGAKVDDGQRRRGSTSRTCSTRSASGSPTPTAPARPTSSISAATAFDIYLNEAGNGWSEAASAAMSFRPSTTSRPIYGHRFPRPRHGLPALVVAAARRCRDGTLRYVDLMCGQKPHLLIRIVNNLGAETRIEYASSTEFYLADKAAGTPWVTRLPFPVHVVEARRNLRLHQPQPLRHELQLSSRLLRRRRSASSAASAGSTSSTPKNSARSTASGAFPAGRQRAMPRPTSRRC